MLSFFSFNKRREAVSENGIRNLNSNFKFVLRYKILSAFLLAILSLSLAIFIINCDSKISPVIIVPTGSPDLTTTEVETLIALEGKMTQSDIAKVLSRKMKSVSNTLWYLKRPKGQEWYANLRKEAGFA